MFKITVARGRSERVERVTELEKTLEAYQVASKAYDILSGHQVKDWLDRDCTLADNIEIIKVTWKYEDRLAGKELHNDFLVVLRFLDKKEVIARFKREVLYGGTEIDVCVEGIADEVGTIKLKREKNRTEEIQSKANALVKAIRIGILFMKRDLERKSRFINDVDQALATLTSDLPVYLHYGYASEFPEEVPEERRELQQKN